MSKGSRPRPRTVSREEYERRWAETFGGGDVPVIPQFDAWTLGGMVPRRGPKDDPQGWARYADALHAEPDATGHP